MATALCAGGRGSNLPRMTEPEILEAYPQLAVEDLREALWYAAEAVTIETLPAVPVGKEGPGGRVPA